MSFWVLLDFPSLHSIKLFHQSLDSSLFLVKLVGYGVKHLQFSSFLSITLTMGLKSFYIVYYIDLLNWFPFTHFTFPITSLLGLPLYNATNWSVTCAIPVESLLPCYYHYNINSFSNLFSYTNMCLGSCLA